MVTIPGQAVLETDRLVLRRFSCADDADALFVLDLLNRPAYLRFIGDKGVRTLEDAHRYLENGPIASYEKNGFGLYLVTLKETGAPLGLCGLIRRDTLPDVDIGYALHPDREGQGYAIEAARAVLRYGQETLGLRRIVAITTFDNAPSMRLLAKLGLQLEKRIRLEAEGPEVNLFGIEG